LANLFKLGPVPNNELLNYYQKADILLMAYNAAKFSHQITNAHKILEYLASGKVIVSNFVFDYRDKVDLLNMADMDSDINSVFEKVLLNVSSLNGKQMTARRIEFAMKNTYSKRIEEIEDLILHHHST
jgi:glycosyltransferase involved in cell wall biosynthesis